MKPFLVCPVCGNPSLDVEFETVKQFLTSIDESKFNWGLCTNPICDVSYHSPKQIYYNNDLNVQIWFKSDKKNVPICYCSNLTKEEIEFAVQNGKNSIDEVQEYTNKKITGNCKKMNPTGRCCRNAFIYTIKNKSEIKENSIKECCCCK